jgi:hypothetical protein
MDVVKLNSEQVSHVLAVLDAVVAGEASRLGEVKPLAAELAEDLHRCIAAARPASTAEWLGLPRKKL